MTKLCRTKNGCDTVKCVCDKVVCDKVVCVCDKVVCERWRVTKEGV